MFEKWYLDELMNKNVREIWPLTDKYLIRLIKDILDKTGMSEELKEPKSIPQIIDKHKYSQKSYNALKWIMERLKYSEFMKAEQKAMKHIIHTLKK